MRRRFLSGPVILIAAVVAILGVLCLGAVGYWQYVNSVPPFTPQLPALPIPNGYQKAAKAGRTLSQMIERKEPRTWPYETPPGQAQALLATVRPALDEVRASFRLEWRASPRLTLPPYPREHFDFRACARCFAAESALARRQGDLGAALQRSLDAMELGSKMVRGGGMDARESGIACHATGFHDMEHIVTRLPAGAIPGALERVRRIRSVWPPLSEMWASERITMLASMTEVFRDAQKVPFADRVDEAFSVGDTDHWGTVRFLLTPRRAVLANMDGYFCRLIAESDKPSRQRVSVPVPPDMWSQQLFPLDQGGYFWRYELASTELSLLEVVLAVRLYRLERGRYPDTLDDLARQSLPAVPMDQWGQLVAYRLIGGKPVTYSLGPDGEDDGGLAANAQYLKATTRGDLVFGKLS